MVYYQENIALGSLSKIVLISDLAEEKVEPVFRLLWQKIFSFEKQFSRFLPGSELSIFNRGSGIKQEISPEFKDLLAAAKSLSKTTSGIYNPFMLPAVQSAGYVNSRVPGFEHDQVDNHSGRNVVSFEKLEIGDTWAQIPYGTAIDLGGCGKGYLNEQLRRDIPESISGYWISLGGDVALGGKNENDKPWEVNIENAWDKDKNTGKIITQGISGVATSGVTVHRGKTGKQTWHHLIDPTTLKPAETDVLLATVYDKSILRADVLASCAVILGSQAGLKFLRKQGVRGAVIQSQNNKQSISHFGNGIIIETYYA